MTIDEQIAALLAQAEPLRALPAEDGEAAGLGRLVDQINRLRAQQASGDTGLIAEVATTEDGDDYPPDPFSSCFVKMENGDLHGFYNPISNPGGLAAKVAADAAEAAFQAERAASKRGPGRPRKVEA